MCRSNSFNSFQFLLFIFSPQKKNHSMTELSPLFLNTISSINARIVRIFKLVRFFYQQKLKTIYIYHFNQDIMYFLANHISDICNISTILFFNNPFMKQIYSLKFFQRPGSILGQIGIPHIGDHRVRATFYFTVLNAVVLIQISILIFFVINRLC